MLTKILNQVTVSDGVTRLTDGTLASSTVTMNEALRKIVNSKIPLIDADPALIDSDFNVHWTMVDGRIQP